MKNLIDAPEHRARIAALRQHLNDWIEATGDLGFVLPETKLVREGIWPPAGLQPATPAARIAVAAESRGGSAVTMVSLSCSDPGASIGYRIGEEGSFSGAWQVYAGPFEMPSHGRVIEVQTHRIGHRPTTTRPAGAHAQTPSPRTAPPSSRRVFP